MMNKRSHNVIFNTHTVSGIAISVILFVIFFAGAFSLFKEEIDIWQKGENLTKRNIEEVNFDKILDDLDNVYELQGRDIRIDFNQNLDKISMRIGDRKDSLILEKGKKRYSFYINTETSEVKTYSKNYNLGEFLFHLHFFKPIPLIGRYLAGIVAFFFMFALLTGLLIHWKHIVSSFYNFKTKVSFRRICSDLHTMFGVIGLPFQFMYGLTGAIFTLSILVLLPANILYNGNRDKLMQDMFPQRASSTYEWIGKANVTPILDFAKFIEKANKHWEKFHITQIGIKNYGGVNMKYVFSGEFSGNDRLWEKGEIVFDPYSTRIETEKKSDVSNYVESVQNILMRLHFADFGSRGLKIIYFILALLTCFVIITGVLIWIEARKKKSQRKNCFYSQRIGNIYLAICLSMFPVTALSFLFVKCTNDMFFDKKIAIYTFYFVTWLVFILVLTFKKSNYFTNKICLLLGSVFSLLIPLFNGIFSHHWIWTTYKDSQFEILFIDLLWITIGTISLWGYSKIKNK